VNQTSRGLPPSSGFTNDKHGHISLGQQLGLSPKLLHHWASANEECFFPDLLYVIAGAITNRDILLRGKVTQDCSFELCFFEWPDEETLSAEPERFLFACNILCVREQNDRQFGTHPAQPT
jgi:hypothetical protein